MAEQVIDMGDGVLGVPSHPVTSQTMQISAGHVFSWRFNFTSTYLPDSKQYRLSDDRRRRGTMQHSHRHASSSRTTHEHVEPYACVLGMSI